MDKSKMLKTGLKIGSLVLAGIATVLSDKVTKADTDETIAKEVAKALENQAKES